LLQEMRPRYSLDMRMGGLQSRSGQCEIEKYLFPLSGIEPWPFSS
jgi:hypothetical protein